MARRLTTQDLINDVRSLIDESNQASIDTVRDILPALNRAMDTACNVLARSYEPPQLKYAVIPLTPTMQEYPIPEDAFEKRLLKVEVQIQAGIYNPLTYVSYRDATLLETTVHTSIPMYYTIIADKYRLYPTPTGAYPLRIWYLVDPPPLVVEQGTVTLVNAAQNYVVVDTIGGDLTVDNSLTSSYVNFVDGATGVVKGSCQIQSLTNNRITFKTIPNRTSVLGQTISGTLPGNLADDDLICTVDGSCVSVLKKPFSNFLISMAVSELLNTKLGMPSELTEKVRTEMETIVKESWAGRESYMRVKLVNNHFSRIGRNSGSRF